MAEKGKRHIVVGLSLEEGLITNTLPIAAVVISIVLLALALFPGRLDAVEGNEKAGVDEAAPGRRVTAGIRPAVSVAAALVIGSLGILKLLAPDATAEQQVDLIKALLWPSFACVLLVLFAHPISELITHIKSASFDPKSGKFAFDTQTKAAEQHLKKAQAKKKTGSAAAVVGKAVVEQGSASIARPRSIRGLINERTMPVFHASRILWVDDQPEGNQDEIEAFEDVGIGIDTVRSTDAALSALQREKYDLVLSDMNRAPDSHAGFTLVAAMRTAGIGTPVMLYVGKALSEQNRAAAQGLAIALVTTDPYQLFAAVTRYLVASKSS